MDLVEALQTSLGPAFTVERELTGDSRYRVFVAHDSSIGRRVVVEVAQRDVGAPVDLVRFKREIAFAARLEDPHVVPLLAAGAADGLPYVVSSFVDGETLRTRLGAEEPVPTNEAMRIMRDVAGALAHGHERGVVHRDLRPEDVILTDDGAMVANLGVARALYAAGAPGDPAADNRTDIYALGAIGYELLTGHAPTGDTPEPIQTYRPSLPTGLAPLIMRCIAKDAAARPETAAGVARSLDEIIAPSDSILAALWPVESSTLAARSEYYRNRGVLGLTAVTLALIAAGIVIWHQSNTSSSGLPAPPPTKTMAVLPLTNVGADSAAQYFADGLTDELRSTLARLPGAQMASRGATLAAMSADSGNVQRVGDRLHIGAVITGQIGRVADHIHLTAQLRNLPDTAVRWTATYDRPAADAASLENDVAHAVAGALHIKLPANEKLAISATASAKAHDLYFRGRFLETRHTELYLTQALAMFQQALKEDPAYVAAWSGAASSWALLSDDFIAPKEAVPHLRDAVAHGLALDSTNAALRFIHGRIAYLYDRDARAAQQYMSSALARDPDVPNATVLYPQVLWANGLSDSARAFLRHAVDRDSISPATLFDAWTYARGSGNALDALEFCGRLQALHAGDRCDAFQQVDIGRVDRALAIVQQEVSDAGPRGLDVQLAYVSVLVAANRLDDARKVVAAVDHEATLPGQYMREDDIALMHGAIGDSSAALRWYDRALSAGSAGIGALYWRSATNPLRKDPQLLTFAKRAGLPSPPPYWP